ncbi:MAG: hypothetical protein JWR10_4177 [Rubritepida sp.]|nr:hypothetical protein [Rubritepida sp.]
MSQGQAPWRWALPRLCCVAVLAVLVGLPMLGGLGLGALAWRLSHGPIESSLIARQIEAAVNRPGRAMRIEISRAAVAWEGWHGDAAPLDIRLSGVVLRDAAGNSRGSLPDAAVTLALAPLLRGVLAPASIELRNPNFVLIRDAEGGLSLDLGAPAAATPAAAPVEAEADAGGHILADLMQPPEERAAHTSLRRIRVAGGLITVRDQAIGRDWALTDPQVELRRLPEGGIDGDGEAKLRVGEVDLPVHLQGRAQGAPMRFFFRLDLPVLRPAELANVLPPLAPLAILDAPVAIQASAEFDAAGRPLRFGLDLQANEGGDLRLDFQARLPFARLEARLDGNRRRFSLEEARIELAGPTRTTLNATGELSRGGTGWSGQMRFGLARLDLAELPTLWPIGMAPETREAARLALPRGTLRDATLRIELTADAALTGWHVPAGRLEAALADALLVSPTGPRAALSAVEFAVEARPDSVRLERLMLRPSTPAGDGAQPTTITADGQAALREGRWRGAVNLGLDRARFADLPAIWPEGVVPGARQWITRNITAGELNAGRWQLTAEAPEDLSGASVTGLSGQAELRAGTVHWLRPMPPARVTSGRVTFGLDEITVVTTGGRQENEAGQLGGLEIRDSNLRFLFPNGAPPRTEMVLNVGGPLAEMVTVLRHPRLHLFDRRPFPVQVAAGALEGRVTIGFPLIAELNMDQVRIRAEARATNARLTRLLFNRDLDDASFELTTDTEQLRVTGHGNLIGIPVRLGVEMDFRPGPATQVVSRETLTGRADAARIAELGFDAGALLRGPVAIEARGERRRSGQASYNLRGDLRDAVLTFSPLGWVKPEGSPGIAEAVIRLQGEQLTSIDNIRVEALELALRARATARAGRIERIELQETSFGASRMVGDARAPTAAGEPWTVQMRGPVLDLRSIFGAPGQVSGGGVRDRGQSPEPPADPPGGNQAPLALDLRFDQVLLGPEREIYGIQGRGRIDGTGVLREGNLRGRTARQTGNFEIAMTPRGDARNLRGTAEDGGGLLRALGLVETIRGGRLTATAQYAESRPGSPLTGTAELENFTVRNAPALGKLLQAMTLFGLVEAVQGGNGLLFNRAVVPFSLTPAELRITDARAFSASLGITARGRVLRERAILDLEGTIVPAYFFNTLLGNLPLIGRLFSPEAGGGVFAATFRAQGPPDDAEITVNPLAALTPGFLRGLFGLADAGRAAR